MCRSTDAVPAADLLGRKLLEKFPISAICRGINELLLNDRLLTAEECQTPLVEAGLDILNAIKDSIARQNVKDGIHTFCVSTSGIKSCVSKKNR